MNPDVQEKVSNSDKISHWLGHLILSIFSEHSWRVPPINTKVNLIKRYLP